MNRNRTEALSLPGGGGFAAIGSEQCLRE